MSAKHSFVLAFAAIWVCPGLATAGMTLGTAGNFSVLAGSTVTNTGLSVIDGGDLGVSSGTSITGFPGGILATPYQFHTEDAATTTANADLMVAYLAASALTPTVDLTGQDLGGLTLLPGVYHFATSAQLTGILTLDNQGDPNAQFVFQIGSTLAVAAGSSVVTTGGGSIGGANVFWQVGSSATIGVGAALEGHLLALSSITLQTGASILDGSALAINGAVILDDNRITNNLSAVPEPSSAALALIGGALAAWPLCRVRKTGPRRPTAGGIDL